MRTFDNLLKEKESEQSRPMTARVTHKIIKTHYNKKLNVGALDTPKAEKYKSRNASSVTPMKQAPLRKSP